MGIIQKSDVIKSVIKTEAEILNVNSGNSIKPGMNWPAVDTGRKIWLALDGVTFTSSRGEVWVDGEWLTAENDPARAIVHGFVDPDGVVFVFDNATRTLTYTHPSGFVQFWSGRVFYSLANGDARLTVTVANATQPSWSYLDIDGQLKYKTTLDWVDVDSVCLTHLAKYSTTHVNPDTSVGGFILSIARWEDCQANHVENKASYLSKGVQVVRGQSIDFTAAIGDTITGYTSASYLSARDFQFWISSANAEAINWLRYHYDGVDDVGQFNAILSVSPAPTGTPIIVAEDVGLVGTNAIYNIETNGVFSVGICPSNDFVIGQIGIADGGTQNVISLAPQGKFSTLGEAQAAIEAQEKKLTNNDNIFRDIAVVASFIVKGNLSGGFLDATGDGDAFYMHDIAGQGGGGGGANNQGLQDVIGIDPIATSKPDFQGGATIIDGVAATDAATFGQLTAATKYGASTYDQLKTIIETPVTSGLLDIHLQEGISVPAGESFTLQQQTQLRGAEARLLGDFTLECDGNGLFLFSELESSAGSTLTINGGAFYARNVGNLAGTGVALVVDGTGQLLYEKDKTVSLTGAVTQQYWDNTTGALDASLGWANVTPLTGYTLDGTTPMQYALSREGQLLFKGRLTVTSGSVDTSANNALCSIPSAIVGASSLFGDIQYNVISSVVPSRLFVSSAGSVTTCGLSGGGVITCGTIICEDLLILNRS